MQEDRKASPAPRRHHAEGRHEGLLDRWRQTASWLDLPAVRAQMALVLYRVPWLGHVSLLSSLCLEPRPIQNLRANEASCQRSQDWKQLRRRLDADPAAAAEVAKPP